MKSKLKFCFVKQNSTLMGTGRELTKQKKKKTAFLRLLLLVWFVIFLLLFFLINHFPFYPIMALKFQVKNERKKNPTLMGVGRELTKQYKGTLQTGEMFEPCGN